MKTVRIILFLALSAFIISACASDGGGGGGAYPAGYSAPPAGSPFAKLTINGTVDDVRKALGEPDNATNAYSTGKMWIPFYSGSDLARADWMYTGQGRIVFSQDRRTKAFKIIKILYNPNEK